MTAVRYRMVRTEGQWWLEPSDGGDKIGLTDFVSLHGTSRLKHLVREQRELDEQRARMYQLRTAELLEIEGRIAFYGSL